MESAHEHPARAHEHPAASEHDVQYAMESAYTTETPRGQGGGDAYSQSLDPPNLSSFSEDNAAEGEAGAKLNAEESAALRSFLAGGDESGEGVVVDWSVVLPLAQAVCLLCAFVIVVCGLTTPNWKLGVALGAHGRATVGLKQLVLLDVRPKSAGIFALSDVCKGFDAPMTAAVVNATKVRYC
ncbi:hypothetical protein T492DRAFT_866921 [Pavlovales sp. CCMP2436]|nr:hypothetical protein T492DRAFT_866921 [Pavlovales sp. CCMP2436]